MRWYDGTRWCYDSVLAVSYVIHIYLLNFHLVLLPSFFFLNRSFLETMLDTTTLFSVASELLLPGKLLVPTWIINMCRLFFLHQFYKMFHILNFAPEKCFTTCFLWFIDFVIASPSTFFTIGSPRINVVAALVLVFKMIDFRGFQFYSELIACLILWRCHLLSLVMHQKGLEKQIVKYFLMISF